MIVGAVSGSAFVLSWVLVLAVRTMAVRHGMLDVPNARSSHVRPTPRVGGIGILVAIILSVGGVATAASLLTYELLLVLALATAVSLVSLLDDLRGLPALARLAMHLATGSLAVAWLGPIHLVVAGHGADHSIVARVLTMLWVAGFINAFNFMDGTDGIAAAQATVAATGWGVAGWWLNEPVVTMLAAAVAAASAAFLLYNWSPASIFMGDVGSALLGLLLATLPLLVSSRPSLLAASLPVWPFVGDTTITLIRRARRGENLLAAHRSHLYQRLTQAGWTHRRTATLYAVLAVPGTVVAVAMAAGVLHTRLPGLAVLVFGSPLLWMLTVREEARHRTATVGVTPARGSGDA